MAEKEKFDGGTNRHRYRGPAEGGGQPQEAPNIANREWLGLRELTYYANISERTLRSWIYSPSDPLPATKVGGKVLVRKTDFDSYLQRHRVKPFVPTDVDSLVRTVLSQTSERQ
jgi:excisionase family DNA binding protein